MDRTIIGAYESKYELRNMNQNEERLIELCELSKLVITSTIFPHKNIHNVTFNSPDNNTHTHTHPVPDSRY